MVNEFRNAGDDVLDVHVESLLAAAAAPAEPGPLPGEAEALAAFRAARGSVPACSPTSFPRPVRVGIAAVMSTGVLLAGGMSAAAAGALPDAAQDTASRWLAKVGLSVPGADGRSADRPDVRGHSDATPGEQGADGPAGERQELRPEPGATGEALSDAAQQRAATGRARGAAVLDLGSDTSHDGGTDLAGPRSAPPAAVPAQPAEPATPAGPATPAEPATPAVPAEPGKVGAAGQAQKPPPKTHPTPAPGKAPGKASDKASDGASDRASDGASDGTPGKASGKPTPEERGHGMAGAHADDSATVAAGELGALRSGRGSEGRT